MVLFYLVHHALIKNRCISATVILLFLSDCNFWANNLFSYVFVLNGVAFPCTLLLIDYCGF